MDLQFLQLENRNDFDNSIPQVLARPLESRVVLTKIYPLFELAQPMLLLQANYQQLEIFQLAIK